MKAAAGVSREISEIVAWRRKMWFHGGYVEITFDL